MTSLIANEYRPILCSISLSISWPVATSLIKNASIRLCDVSLFFFFFSFQFDFSVLFFCFVFEPFLRAVTCVNHELTVTHTFNFDLATFVLPDWSNLRRTLVSSHVSCPMTLNTELPGTGNGWTSLPVCFSDTSLKTVERLESVKEVSTTPLSSFSQGRTWQRPSSDTLHVKKVLIVTICFRYLGPSTSLSCQCPIACRRSVFVLCDFRYIPSIPFYLFMVHFGSGWYL